MTGGFPPYGLGFTLRDEKGMRTADHGASVAGYNADLRFDLNSRIGIAVLRTATCNPPSGKFLGRLVESRGESRER